MSQFVKPNIWKYSISIFINRYFFHLLLILSIILDKDISANYHKSDKYNLQHHISTMSLYKLLHLQSAFCQKTGKYGLKTLIFNLKSGNLALPCENVTHLKVLQAHKTVGMIFRLETCMAF